MKKAFFFLFMALLVSALKNISVPQQYNILLGLEGRQQTVNNLIYFTGIDLILICLMACIIAICSFSILVIKKMLFGVITNIEQGIQLNNLIFSIEHFRIISYGALWLAIGKLIDEFTSPYGYHEFEFVYDLFILTCTLISLFRHKFNPQQ